MFSTTFYVLGFPPHVSSVRPAWSICNVLHHMITCFPAFHICPVRGDKLAVNLGQCFEAIAVASQALTSTVLANIQLLEPSYSLWCSHVHSRGMFFWLLRTGVPTPSPHFGTTMPLHSHKLQLFVRYLQNSLHISFSSSYCHLLLFLICLWLWSSVLVSEFGSRSLVSVISDGCKMKSV
jgi:hypothetical protein